LNQMKPKILLTGGSGLLALNWAIEIQKHYSVTICLHERDVFIPGIRAKWLELDSVEKLVQNFKLSQCELVIHTVGLTNVDVCEAKPDLARHINIQLAINVAKACAELGLPLVHISTDHLFSGKNQLVDEDHPVAPRNVYGQTKAEAEIRVLEVHAASLVIRTNFYGWGPSYRRSFSDLIIDALRLGKELILFKDVFYTPILIEILVKTVHELIKVKARGIYHVVGDDRISKYEFGLHLAEVFNFDKSLIKQGFITDQRSMVQRPNDMSLSNQKTCMLLSTKLGSGMEHIAKLREQELSGSRQAIFNI
jgi:dTDP-4-dehydrorhamnose reductase